MRQRKKKWVASRVRRKRVTGLRSSFRDLTIQPLEQRWTPAIMLASATAPVIDNADIAVLSGAFTSISHESLVWNNRPVQGQSFTTGSNPAGYTLTSFTYLNDGIQSSTVLYGPPGLNFNPFVGRVGSISGTTFTQVASESSSNPNGFFYNSTDYITFAFSTPVTLLPNTTYAVDLAHPKNPNFAFGFSTAFTNDTSTGSGLRYSTGGNASPDDDNLMFAANSRVFHVNLTANNNVPALGGAVANQAVNDNATLDPFTSFTIEDADLTQTLTIGVQLSDAANGAFTAASLTASGFVDLTGGLYRFIGAAADAQAAIRQLVFDPTDNQVAPGSTTTTTFTVTANDGVVSTPTSNSATTVVASSINDDPVLGGAVANQTVNDTATISPFASFTIQDVDPQILSVNVQLSDAANGAFTAASLTASGFVDLTGGRYRFIGAAADAQAAIRQLVFDPTDNQVAPGSTTTTTFTVTADDGVVSTPTSNSATTVVASSINDDPVLGGAVANQTVNDTATISPFASFTIQDVDPQILSVNVQLSDAANGAFTAASLTASGFVDLTGGLYRFIGAAADAQAAIRQLVFDPNSNPTIADVTTFFTVSADDSVASPVINNNTSVVATSQADLAVAIEAAPEPVHTGSNLVYTITVDNLGPSNAASAEWTMTIPVGATFVSLTSPAGWSATTPAVGAAGTVTATHASLPPGTYVFTLTVAVGHLPLGAMLTAEVAVNTLTSDGDPSNDADQLDTAVSVDPGQFLIGFDSRTATWFGSHLSTGNSQALAQWNPANGWRDAVVADFNGDGVSDIAARNAAGQWWVGLAQPGSAELFDATRWASTVRRGFQSIDTGDVNRDGRADVIVYDRRGVWRVFTSDGQDFAGQKLKFHRKVEWSNPIVADFNGDGRSDLAARDLRDRSGANAWWVALAQPTGNFGRPQVWGKWDAAAWMDVHALDYNGDGKSDLVGRDPDTGRWQFAESVGNGFESRELGSRRRDHSLAWQSVLVADLDGDGRDDIVGQKANGNWFYIHQNGGQDAFSRSLGRWSPADRYDDVFAADLDRDGQDELFGRRADGLWRIDQLAGKRLATFADPARQPQWDAAVDWALVDLGHDNGNLF